MVNTILLLLLCSLLLSSCAPQGLKTPLPTPMSITPTMVTETPVTVATETASPTSTVEPSATPLPDEKSLKAMTDDGKWEVSVRPGYESSVQVTSVDGKVKWVLDEKTIPGTLVGEFGTFQSSNDNTSIYFEVGAINYESLILYRWPPRYGLYKLNLADGKVEAVLGPHMDASGRLTDGYFELSPDESQIIYSWWGDPAIIVRNLTSLNEQTIPLPSNYRIAGPFVWSPDGQAVIFTMWTDAWNYPTDFQVVRLDMNDKSMHSLYSDNEKNRFFIPTEWAEKDLVYLVDRRADEKWQINPVTGQLQKRVSTTP